MQHADLLDRAVTWAGHTGRVVYVEPDTAVVHVRLDGTPGVNVQVVASDVTVKE